MPTPHTSRVHMPIGCWLVLVLGQPPAWPSSTPEHTAAVACPTGSSAATPNCDCDAQGYDGTAIGWNAGTKAWTHTCGGMWCACNLVFECGAVEYCTRWPPGYAHQHTVLHLVTCCWELPNALTACGGEWGGRCAMCVPTLYTS